MEKLPIFDVHRHVLVNRIGSDNVMHGSDSPYPLGDGISYVTDSANNRPGLTIELAAKYHGLNKQNCANILFGNHMSWLLG